LEDDKATVAVAAPAPAAEEVKTVSKSTMVTVVQLDETFIDFWGDALLDPISSTWPNFVICKLKNSISGAEIANKPVEWLVIKHAYSRVVSPPTPQVKSRLPQSSKKQRLSYLKPSFWFDLSSSRMATTLAATRKWLNFFDGPIERLQWRGENHAALSLYTIFTRSGVQNGDWLLWLSVPGLFGTRPAVILASYPFATQSVLLVLVTKRKMGSTL
jgi:hypothetical protein